MKTNSNDCAFAVTGSGFNPAEKGLTKLEYFAAMAMQGLCSDGFGKSAKTKMDDMRNFEATIDVSQLVSGAVAIADTLIEELNK